MGGKELRKHYLDGCRSASLFVLYDFDSLQILCSGLLLVTFWYFKTKKYHNKMPNFDQLVFDLGEILKYTSV